MIRQSRSFRTVLDASLLTLAALVLVSQGTVAAKDLIKQQTPEDSSESTVVAPSRQAAFDPFALAAMGATAGEIQQIEQAATQAKETPVGYGGSRPATRGAPPSATPLPESTVREDVSYSPEFCEILERWNAEKRIVDSETRNLVEGQYGRSDDVKRLRTWKVDTACGNFLVAAPMWADVSPSVLSHQGGSLFEDSQGTTWDFQLGSDGTVVGVTIASADGTVSELKHWGDPHINHKNDKEKWDVKQ